MQFEPHWNAAGNWGDQKKLLGKTLTVIACSSKQRRIICTHKWGFFWNKTHVSVECAVDNSYFWARFGHSYFACTAHLCLFGDAESGFAHPGSGVQTSVWQCFRTAAHSGDLHAGFLSIRLVTVQGCVESAIFHYTHTCTNMYEGRWPQMLSHTMIATCSSDRRYSSMLAFFLALVCELEHRMLNLCLNQCSVNHTKTHLCRSRCMIQKPRSWAQSSTEGGDEWRWDSGPAHTGPCRNRSDFCGWDSTAWQSARCWRNFPFICRRWWSWFQGSLSAIRALFNMPFTVKLYTATAHYQMAAVLVEASLGNHLWELLFLFCKCQNGQIWALDYSLKIQSLHIWYTVYVCSTFRDTNRTLPWNMLGFCFNIFVITKPVTFIRQFDLSDEVWIQRTIAGSSVILVDGSNRNSCGGRRNNIKRSDALNHPPHCTSGTR